MVDNYDLQYGSIPRKIIVSSSDVTGSDGSVFGLRGFIKI